MIFLFIFLYPIKFPFIFIGQKILLHGIDNIRKNSLNFSSEEKLK